MKFAVTLAVLAITGCTTAIDQDTSTTDQAATVSIELPHTDTTCQWSVDTICYGQRNDGNNLWPTGIGITSAYVLTRRGPTRLSGRQPTYLAFVVWNDSVIGCRTRPSISRQVQLPQTPAISKSQNRHF